METEKEPKRPSNIPQPVTLRSTATPPPLTLRPNEIPPPVTPRPRPSKIESPASEETDCKDIPMGISEYEEIRFVGTECEKIASDRTEDVQNEMDNPPINHGIPHPAARIQPWHVSDRKAASSKRSVRISIVILTSTAVFTAVTVASIIGGTLILSKGKDTKKMDEKKSAHSL